MVRSPLESFLPILLFFAFSAGLVIVALLVSKVFRPNKPTKLKLTPYECGELPVGSAWSAFNIRFYVIALIFIIFDVESAVIFPVATVFKKMSDIGLGAVVFTEISIFIGILIVGIVYCWSKGDLDWVKSYSTELDKKTIDTK